MSTRFTSGNASHTGAAATVGRLWGTRHHPWTPLTSLARPGNPVAPARRSASAEAKAFGQHDENGRPYRSFPGLLAHLSTLTRSELRFPGTNAAIPVLTEPTSEQRQAFGLIEAPVPLTRRK